MLAVVLLAPGGGLSRAQRRMAEALPRVECTLRGYPDGAESAPLPEHFHETTLRWTILSADKIAIWSAPHPQLIDDVALWNISAVNAGSRFITTIATTEERAPEWAALIERWKRKSTPVELFSAKVAGGMQ